MPAARRAAPRTLLLVDDSPDILSALQLLLRDEGLRILAAESAEDGLRLLALNAVDVVISDLQPRPVGDAEFLSRVKHLYPDAVRMALPGCTEPRLVNDALKHGAIHRYLIKPWKNAQLRETVREAFLIRCESDR